MKMSVRSLTVKLDVDKSPEWKLALWKTHTMTNQGVRFYTEWLLRLRQGDIYYQGFEDTAPKIIKSAAEYQEELLQYARTLQQERLGMATGTDAEILHLLRQLYTLIVPSSVNSASGDSKSLGRKFLSPLTDPRSHGGQGKSTAGAKPQWKKLRDAGDPKWLELYEKWQARQVTDLAKPVLESLAMLGLKPFMALYTDTVTDVAFPQKAKNQFVRDWDRMMFPQAIERLLSWESWNRRVKDEREKLSERHSHFYAQNFSSPRDHELYAMAEGLEEAIRRDRETVGFASTDPDAYKIRSEAVNGLDRLTARWLKLAERGREDEFLTVVSRVQAELRQKFGDADLFRRLTEVPWRNLWATDPRFLLRYAKFNDLSRKLARAKHVANLTLPDAIDHPIWARFDNSGINYHITLMADTNIVTFEKMIWPGEDGWEEQAKVRAPLRPSKQLSLVRVIDDGDPKSSICIRDQSSERAWQGAWGGAKLMFSRPQLSKRQKRLHLGNTGPVYLSATVDLDVPKAGVPKVFSCRGSGRIRVRPQELMSYYTPRR